MLPYFCIISFIVFKNQDEPHNSLFCKRSVMQYLGGINKLLCSPLYSCVLPCTLVFSLVLLCSPLYSSVLPCTLVPGPLYTHFWTILFSLLYCTLLYSSYNVMYSSVLFLRGLVLFSICMNIQVRSCPFLFSCTFLCVHFLHCTFLYCPVLWSVLLRTFPIFPKLSCTFFYYYVLCSMCLMILWFVLFRR